MNTKIITALLLSICLGVSSSAVIAKDPNLGNVMVLNLIGTSEGTPSTVPDIDGDGEADDATCFTVDLVNAKNGHWIGSADDCLSMIEAVDGGISLVGTTYFHLPQGTLVTRGKTTVQPAVTNIVTRTNRTMTHITGAAGAGNAILEESTGRFTGQEGTVRLSGMVDMSVEGEITFDCLFVIALN